MDYDEFLRETIDRMEAIAYRAQKLLFEEGFEDEANELFQDIRTELFK